MTSLSMSSPPLDAVDHKMRLATPCSFNLHLPEVTVGEPIKWETSLKVWRQLQKYFIILISFWWIS